MTAMTYVRDLGPRDGDRRWRRAQAALHAGKTRIAHIDTGLAPHPSLGFTGETPPPNIRMDEGLNFHDPLGGPRGPVATLTKGKALIEDLTEYPDHGVKTLSVILSDNARLRGVAPGAHVVPYRVANGPVFRAKARTGAIGSAIDHALGLPDPPRVFSISMGNPGFAGAFEGLRRLLSGETVMAGETRRAIDRAYEAGCVVVCAAGQVIDTVVYPARFPRCIAVGGFDMQGALHIHYPRDGYGPGEKARVDVWARAEGINRAAAHLDAAGRPVFTHAEDEADIGGEPSGTSYACPQVAAAAALWIDTHRAALDALGGGWRVTETFRRALTASARKVVAQGADGRGKAGPILALDVERLLATPPGEAAGLAPRGASVDAGFW
ncbi:MAG: hypothetical protein EA355_03805 [Rhodobacteraceae bacterium]|nr:MAG: hypothetical protein EA355_03805 [Paracoccaceae bacterium]